MNISLILHRLIVSRPGAALVCTLVGILFSSCALDGATVAPVMGVATNADGSALVKDPVERQRMAQAIPARPWATPKKARQLLIFNSNVGYGGHPSMAHAAQAFMGMGEKTGAFQTVISSDPAIFQTPSLQRFDAVFFNNTVGNLFEDPVLRQNLIDFVYGGGGLLGVHGTSVAFTRWPGAIEDWSEFGLLLGARGANHRESDERVFIKVEDSGHPLTRMFPAQGFEFRDEFFRVHEPYSRDHLRILLSIDTNKTDLTQGQARGDCLRPDQDYALAWIHRYGRGRVFYSTIAHNPYVFWDRSMLEFYLAAVQYALGDLPAGDTPSARLTAATAAQEKLGWRLALAAYPDSAQTLFDAIELAAKLKLSYLGTDSRQTVSATIAKPFDNHLTAEERQQIRLKLHSAGVQLLTYDIQQLPADALACQPTFEFAHKMGIETVTVKSPPSPATWNQVESACEQWNLGLALRSSTRTSEPPTTKVRSLLRLLERRSPRIGYYGDLASWARAGQDPMAVVRALKERWLMVGLSPWPPGQPPSPPQQTSPNPDLITPCLHEIHRLGLKPILLIPQEPIAHQPTMTPTLDLIPRLDALFQALAHQPTSHNNP